AVLLHTGQHYDDSMSRSFFADLELPQPRINLGVGSASHARQTAAIMVKFEDQLAIIRPQLVVVVGDVNSTMACALVCAKEHIRVAHVEAGLRSFDRNMPEEINRMVTDRLADLLFTTCEEANVNLASEGIGSEKIFLVGNTMIDALVSLRPKYEAAGAAARFGLNSTPFAFVTIHRPSNVDDKPILAGICDALQCLQHERKLFWPLHPRTKSRLKQHGLWQAVNRMTNLIITDPLGYIDSMSVMASSSLVLTDSGGIQEETTALGIPCLTLRNNTERNITILEGTNELVGNKPEGIVRRAKEILQSGGKRGRIPRLWDGKAATRIVDLILGLVPN
ncbi:MAG TPA: UDP-N-acetylglucosamine 2-epimerase (non-hydrolyzing), partial [Bacteroidota bacterium]|nr:UDP-N-acetylglucosamine 2-epimerase (non-hydrolyzing) [Bacteroidota bacterium]